MKSTSNGECEESMKKTLIQGFTLAILFGCMATPAIAQTQAFLASKTIRHPGESCPGPSLYLSLGATQPLTIPTGYELWQSIWTRNAPRLASNLTTGCEIQGATIESPSFTIVSDAKTGDLTKTRQLNAALSNTMVKLILDDDTNEKTINLHLLPKFIILNRFTPEPEVFPLLLTEILVYFDSTGLVEIGDRIILVVYENTTNDTDPAMGAKLLGKYPTSVQDVDTWNSFVLPTGVYLNGPGDVLIGVIFLETRGDDYEPAALDTTTSQERSWMGSWGESLPEDLLLPQGGEWGLINEFGHPGNWLVRGSGVTMHNRCFLPLIIR